MNFNDKVAPIEIEIDDKKFVIEKIPMSTVAKLTEIEAKTESKSDALIHQMALLLDTTVDVVEKLDFRKVRLAIDYIMKQAMGKDEENPTK